MRSLNWLYEPFEGRPLAFVKGVYRYLTSYQYRVGARARHISCSSGGKANYLARRLVSKHKIIFAATAAAGRNLNLIHPFGVIVGVGVQLGDNVSLYQNVTVAMSRTERPTTVGDNVIVYANAVILGGVQVGDRAVIGAGSVVTGDVPANAIVAGVPAKVIRYREQRDEELF